MSDKFHEMVYFEQRFSQKDGKKAMELSFISFHKYGLYFLPFMYHIWVLYLNLLDSGELMPKFLIQFNINRTLEDAFLCVSLNLCEIRMYGVELIP